jgi:PAS domain S-box-containing protein
VGEPIRRLPGWAANGYAVAVGATAAVAAGRAALHAALGQTALYMPFVAAVAAAAYVGGLRPGLLATALSATAVVLLFADPAALGLAPAAVGAVTFTLIGAAVSGVCERLHVLRRRLEAVAGERARAVDEARAGEGRFRVLADAMPQIVYVSRPDGSIEYLNRRWREYTGTAAADPDDLAAVIPAEDLAVLALRWQTAPLTGEFPATEFRLRRYDGAYRWFLTRAVAIRDAGGRLVNWFGTSTDIHDQKTTEQALRASDERYRAFVAASTEGVYRLEFDPPVDTTLPVEEQIDAAYRAGRFAECNDAFARMYGYDRADELVGLGMDAMLPADDPAARGYLRGVMANGYRADDAESAERDRAGNAVYFANALAGVVEGGRLVRVWGTQRDVTARRRAEDAARQHAAEMDTLLDTLPVGVLFAHDPDCRRITANPAGRALLRMGAGGNVSRSAPDGERPAHVRICRDGVEIPPDELPMQRAARGDVVPGEEVEYRFADGSVAHALVTAAPLRGPDGRVRGAVAGVLDVTDRKRAEAAVRAGEERLRQLLESLSDGFVAFDPGFRHAYVNAASLRLTGQRLEDLLGRTQWEVYPACVGTGLERAFRRVMAERVTVEFENHYEPWDRWYALKVFPVPDGGIGVLYREVTESKRAEAAVRASEERYRTLFEAMDEGYCIIEMLFDPPDGDRAVDYRFVEVNPAFEAQSGMRQVVGRRMREFVTDIEEHWLANYGRVARTGEPIRFANEYTGLNRWFEVYAFRVGPPGGNRVAVLFTDITARKRAERGQEELLDRLREADRRKDEFLATLAHELRNPLAPIRNAVEIIRLAGADGPVAQARAVMDRQLTQLVRLVDDLLDVSRITRGKLELRPERCDLRAAVAAAVETARPLLDRAGHAFAEDVPADPVPVDADPARIAQVVGNLLTNAAKYTPRGGSVRLAVGRDGPDAAVTVTDTGVGIPPDMLDRVFDMFTQVDRSLEKSAGGLGIGLALARGLAEMHGGTIAARSGGEGRGSEFVLRLPLAADAPAEGTDRPGQARPLARRRVLVVDDNTDAAQSLADLLGLLGHDARTAHDGEAGVAAAEAFRPHLVLMDLGMPRLNGYDAARRIRAEPWGGGMVLVALTGWGQEDDRRRTAEAGFDRHLVKPVDPAALAGLLADGVA